jgi:hypothetical protein
MKITITIKDISKERIERHPHKLVAGEACLVFDEEGLAEESVIQNKPIGKIVSEQVAGHVEAMLFGWGY